MYYILKTLTKDNIMFLTPKMKAQGSISTIIDILNEHEQYGYPLIKTIHRVSNVPDDVYDGMFYPVLHRMVARGKLRSFWAKNEQGKVRKYYEIIK